MVRASSAALGVVSSCLIAACSVTPRTEVIVVTDTDLRGPGGLDEMVIEVTAPDGTMMQRATARLGPGDPPLPRTLGLLWSSGALGRFTVRVSGNIAGVTRLTRSARFSFVQGQTRVLRIDLLGRCVGVACASTETCGEMGCRALDVADSELLPWTGVVPGLDAGVAPVDGGPDVGPRDGGPDAGLDGGPDAGLDGGSDAGTDAGFDAAIDAGADGGSDAGSDTGTDAGSDAGTDSGVVGAPPSIVSSDYAVVAHGGRVRLTGTGFSSVTGVRVGGVVQAFVVVDDATIDLTDVPDTTPLDVQPVVLEGPIPQAGTYDLTVIHLVVTEVNNETSAGADVLQFIEVETGVPGVDLTGYVVVVYGGTADTSYLSRALSVADASGRVLLGNAGVVPMPSIAFPDETLGNAGMVEAVAIYQAATFADGTPVTAVDLIDAVLYARSGAADAGLANVLLVVGGRMTVNENARTMERADSVQRCMPARRDARAWRVLAATPGAANICP